MRELVSIKIEVRNNKGQSSFWYQGPPYTADIKAMKKRLGKLKTLAKNQGPEAAQERK